METYVDLTTAAENTVTENAGNTTVKDLAVIGGVMTAGALLWEFVIKPVGAKAVGAVKHLVKKQTEKIEIEPGESEVN